MLVVVLSVLKLDDFGVVGIADCLDVLLSVDEADVDTDWCELLVVETLTVLKMVVAAICAMHVHTHVALFHHPPQALDAQAGRRSGEGQNCSLGWLKKAE